MVGIALGLLLFVATLALVAYLRARNAAHVFVRVVAFLDQSTKRVGAVALVPGLATAAYILHRGVDPVPALIVGCIAALGVFAVALAILKMEGMLTEPESAAAFRLAAGTPAPSSTAGRIAWTAIGLALLAACLLALHVASF